MSAAAVTTYATRGLRLWAQFDSRHGERCGCLPCADARAYLRMPPLTPAVPGREPAERRAAS